jgi:hypothetical protein
MGYDKLHFFERMDNITLAHFPSLNLYDLNKFEIQYFCLLSLLLAYSSKVLELMLLSIP